MSLGVLNRRKTHSKVRRSWGYSSQHSRKGSTLFSTQRKTRPLSAPGGLECSPPRRPRLCPEAPTLLPSSTRGSSWLCLNFTHVESHRAYRVQLPPTLWVMPATPQSFSPCLMPAHENIPWLTYHLATGGTLVVVPGLGWLHPRRRGTPGGDPCARERLSPRGWWHTPASRVRGRCADSPTVHRPPCQRTLLLAAWESLTPDLC